MPTPYQPLTVEPRQGGDLVTTFSNENVGAANYVVKRDWRRFQDAEVRREGDTYFQPNTAVALGTQPYPQGTTGSPITLVHTARKANGKTAVIVGTATTLYRYYSFEDGEVYTNDVYTSDVYQNLSGSWLTIGTGFSTAGHRWEAVDVAGLTIFNNGVDLPQVYDLGGLSVRPLYELREQGVACVDTIAQYNGMLFCADISNMTPAYLTEVMTLTSSGSVTATSLGPTVTASSGYFTAAMVGQTILFANGMSAKIVAYSSSTVVLVDTPQNFTGLTFKTGLLYGVANDTTRISRNRYQMLNSDIGAPRAFGAIFSATAVSGSTAITLATPTYSIQAGDSVLVSGIGTAGSAVTANVLAVNPANPTSIIIDQASLTTNRSVTFTATANGLAAFQWNFNGNPIVGATASAYTIANVTDADAGVYTATVTNTVNSRQSAPATLTVIPANGQPIITQQPLARDILTGDPMRLNVVAYGNPTPTYAWSFQGNPIDGATDASYFISSFQPSDEGLYSVVVSNSAGTVTSNQVYVSAVARKGAAAPTITVQPTGTTVSTGSIVQFLVQIPDSLVPTPTYQWRVGSTPLTDVDGIFGSSTKLLTLGCARSTQAGNYNVVITNSLGTVTSSNAALTVTLPSGGVEVTTNPVPTVIQGSYDVTVQKASYPAAAIGSEDLQDDGSPILRMVELQGRLIIFKGTAIFIGLFTGVNTAPMQYQRIYSGPDCLFWRWMLTKVDGTSIIYATQKDFFEFDLSNLLPRKHPKLRLCSNLFYSAMTDETQMDRCFTSTNELTREVWAIWPSTTSDKGIAYDYEFETCSTLGAEYTAGMTIQVPVAGITSIPDQQFLLGAADGSVLTYGYTMAQQGLWTRRNHVNYDSTMTSGLISFGDEFDEKDLWAYIPFARSYAPLTITLYGARNTNEPKNTLFTQVIPSPEYQTLIPTYFRANYFQDQILVTGSNYNSQIVRRIFDPSKIDTRSYNKSQAT